jgi:hypothetical protein
VSLGDAYERNWCRTCRRSLYSRDDHERLHALGLQLYAQRVMALVDLARAYPSFVVGLKTPRAARNAPLEPIVPIEEGFTWHQGAVPEYVLASPVNARAANMVGRGRLATPTPQELVKRYQGFTRQHPGWEAVCGYVFPTLGLAAQMPRSEEARSQLDAMTAGCWMREYRFLVGLLREGPLRELPRFRQLMPEMVPPEFVRWACTASLLAKPDDEQSARQGEEQTAALGYGTGLEEATIWVLLQFKGRKGAEKAAVRQ